MTRTSGRGLLAPLCVLLCLAGPAAMAQPAGKDALLCGSYRGLPAPTADGAPAGMVQIRGGTFTYGSDSFFPEERPARPATVGTFWIDRTEVTNAQFAAFVAATGYKTLAERGLDPKQYPDLPKEAYAPGSMVFVEPGSALAKTSPGEIWAFVPGADWQHPEGPDSNIADRQSHPVVHVAHDDALAFARWAGRELPSEAEWEFAARGGLNGATFAWGDSANPDGAWLANGWQGPFPGRDEKADGWHGTAPVGCYPANGYGLFDMTGNVWEWVREVYRPGHGRSRAEDPALAVKEPPPGTAAWRVIKGGSWLCSEEACGRVRPAARQGQESDLGNSHVGFRTVLRER